MVLTDHWQLYIQPNLPNYVSMVCHPHEHKHGLDNIGLGGQHFNDSETESVCDVERANETKWDSKPNGQARDMIEEGFNSMM